MTEAKFIPLETYQGYPEEEMLQRSTDFYQEVDRRRTVRDYKDKPVPREIIENCLKAAGTAPSGANMQPWHFVVVENPEIKHKIRVAAEIEEKDFYTRRAPKEWLEALAPLGTDEDKSFLEKASYLIAIFERKYSWDEAGEKIKHYYTTESVGLAAGLLINAVHNAGLVSLTHTPSPMAFLNEVLERPKNERPFLLLVVGYPDEEAQIPDVHRKPFDEIVTFL